MPDDFHWIRIPCVVDWPLKVSVVEFPLQVFETPPIEPGFGVPLQTASAQLEPVMVIPSIKAPVFPKLESVALLHLKTILWPLADAGKFTVVVTHPPLLPVQACLPPIGLPKFKLIAWL